MPIYNSKPGGDILLCLSYSYITCIVQTFKSKVVYNVFLLDFFYFVVIAISEVGGLLSATWAFYMYKLKTLIKSSLILIRINLLFYLFFTVVPPNTCVFLSCRPFVVNTTFSTGLVGVEVSSVSWLEQL